jgi:hypothetical protein
MISFEQFQCLIWNIQNLERFEYKLQYDVGENDLHNLAHINGKQWHQLRRQLCHLVNFSCSITCTLQSLPILMSSVKIFVHHLRISLTGLLIFLFSNMIILKKYMPIQNCQHQYHFLAR